MSVISNSELILQSKDRCKNQTSGFVNRNVDLSNADKNLYKAIQPCIQELKKQKFLNGFYLTITNSDLQIIYVSGDDSLFEKQSSHLIKSGLSFAEIDAGTNAPALALLENKIVKVSGKEHTLVLLENVDCSSAPIHDIENNIVGTVSLWQNLNNNSNTAFALVSMLATTLESKLETHLTQIQFFNSQQYAFAMMNNLSFGVISVNFNDKIFWVNDTACNTLNIRRTHLINSEFLKILPNWSKIKTNIQNGSKYEDEENTFSVNNLNDKFLINAYPINSDEESAIGYIITFRPLKRIINIINKLTGNSTSYHFADIISKNRKFINVINYAKSIANTPTSVLLTGESGTGKEVFAQAIHNASNRHDGPFVAINCGAISSSLMESELFGYEDAAFTGAKKGGRPGKFEMANGGTLFLDEIGDMPLEMQVKLLRTIQENEVVRVGGEKSISINVRIIAATNKNLENEIENKQFRLDLFYRINVISINIPPLRERMEDVNSLIDHFVNIKTEKLNRNNPILSDDFYEIVNGYSWPGNIRELENFIEKTVALEGRIDFNPNYFENEKENVKPNFEFSDNCFVPNTLAEIEMKAIENTLLAFDGNISKTAKCLKIGRNTLYKKIKNNNSVS